MVLRSGYAGAMLLSPERQAGIGIPALRASVAQAGYRATELTWRNLADLLGVSGVGRIDNFFASAVTLIAPDPGIASASRIVTEPAIRSSTRITSAAWSAATVRLWNRSAR